MYSNRTKRRRSKVPYIIMGLIGIFIIIYAIIVINLAKVAENNIVNAAKITPVVISTWNFVDSVNKAWETVYLQKKSALDGIESGCKMCEEEQCDGTVGFGGSPDENSETTLDAMIMDGITMNVGAVADLRRIKNAISVARHVLDYTAHSILAGDQATQFAINMKFKDESLITNSSKAMWKQWRANNCQPNFWMNVLPDPKKSCGPYKPDISKIQNWNRIKYRFGSKNHDTIGLVIVDNNSNIAAGTSTNGARHKIPGRVGDSPIPGAGAYADNDVGAAAATGDGDVMLRFLPSFLAVEEMRRGASPKEAAELAIHRIISKYQTFSGAVITVNKFGEYGAACHNVQPKFPYTVRNLEMNTAQIEYVNCINNKELK